MVAVVVVGYGCAPFICEPVAAVAVYMPLCIYVQSKY